MKEFRIHMNRTKTLCFTIVCVSSVCSVCCLVFFYQGKFGRVLLDEVVTETSFRPHRVWQVALDGSGQFTLIQEAIDSCERPAIHYIN